MISDLHIRNYKSISQLDLLGCKRITVFVGEPNAGKSNILEALDLSYLSWMMGSNRSNKEAGKENIDIKQYFRVNKAADLFHFGNISRPIIISHPGFSYDTSLNYKSDRKSNQSSFDLETTNGSFTRFDNDLNPVDPKQFFGSPVIPYRYKKNVQFHDTGNYIHNLMAPFGNNLAKVIYHNSDMKELAKDFAAENGFEFNINTATDEINLLLRLNEGLVYTLPFEALADTFKRMLFYIAAIRHTNAFVVTLDEPDTHAFPNYVSLLADEIIEQKDRQFFITTHNPYLFGELIEKTPKDELAVFVCGFNKSEKATFARRLSDEDVSELVGYGVDIFFNLNPYLNEDIQHSS